MKTPTFIPYIQVRSNALVYYELPDEKRTYKRHDLSAIKTYTGEVSNGAYQRIRRTVDVFLQKTPRRTIHNTATGRSQPFRLNFTTLTISRHRPVDAKEGHEALKVFLQHFRRPPSKKALSEQLRSYIWKAELQDRGQLHYHITANSFLNIWEVRRVWNGIQYRRGWLDDYIAKYGNTDPNSTDVHAVHKVRDIAAYLSKYLAKTGEKDLSELGFPVSIYKPTINGKVWDCSNDLKVKRFATELDTHTQTKIEEAIKFRRVRRVDFKRATVFCTDDPLSLLGVQAANEYKAWI